MVRRPTEEELDTLVADRKVELPERPAGLEDRPILEDGTPILYINEVDEDGVPTGEIELTKWTVCIRHSLCGACGNKLANRIYFVGGAQAVQDRLFIEAPMHRSCAEWVMNNTPLALRTEQLMQVPNYLYETTGFKIAKLTNGQFALEPDPGVVVQDW